MEVKKAGRKKVAATEFAAKESCLSGDFTNWSWSDPLDFVGQEA